MNTRRSSPPSPPPIARAWVTLAGITFAAVDLAAKTVSEARLADSNVDLGLIQLQLAYNSGVAFSMGDNLPLGVIVAVTATITVAVAVYAWLRAPQARWIERVAGGGVIGGAAANVVDRASDGVVTDYLHTGWWPTFNLADAFLVIGCIAIVLIHARPEQATHNEGQPAQLDPAAPDTKAP